MANNWVNPNSGDPLDQQEEFIDIIDDETNVEIDMTTDRELNEELKLIKNIVIQQIFVNSNMLNEIGEIFGCRITFSFNKDIGSYAFFIKPNDTNYMINITNGNKNGVDRIFFNISLIDKDKPQDKIKTEYISEYNVINGKIEHKYKMEGKPSTLRKNKVDLNKTEKLFNPYFELNELIVNYLEDKTKVSIISSIDFIQSKIEQLKTRPPAQAKLVKIIKMFENQDGKDKIDKLLKKEYAFLKRFINVRFGKTQIEEFNFRIPNKELFVTNNWFTDMLASRYALFIPKFEFTKSCNKDGTYTEPLKYKLATPFTATDIYLHKFDRHFENEYAMDRYNINSVGKLCRLADLVELSKSLMFTFINTSYTILLSSFKTHEMNISIYNVYAGLIWRREIRNIISKNFIVRKEKRIDGRGITLNIDQITKATSLYLLTYMPVIEIPYVGVHKLVDRNEHCRVPYGNQPVVKKDEKRKINEVELIGIERIFYGGQMTRDMLAKLSKDFFAEDVEVGIDVNDSNIGEFISLTPDEFSNIFPDISIARDSKILKSQGIINEITAKPAIMPTSSLSHPTRSTLPTLMVQPIKTTPSIASIVATQIPYGKDISKIIIDIRQFKTTQMKPRMGESRRERGERYKLLNPMIKTLEKLREKQLEAFKELGKPVPAYVKKEEEQLIKDGIIKPTLSRTQQSYQFAITQIERLKKEYIEEEKKISEYARNAKSKIQLQILDIMKLILDKKRELYINIPTTIFNTLPVPKSINATTSDKIKQAEKPVKIELAELNKQLEELKQLETEQLQKIKDTVVRNEEKAEQKEAKSALLIDKKKEEMIERTKKETTNAHREHESFKQKTSRIIEDLNRKLQRMDKGLPIYKYYTYSLNQIEKTLKLFLDYIYALDVFAYAKLNKSNYSIDEMQTFKDMYTEALSSFKSQMEIFNEIEYNLTKNSEEIELIAIKKFNIRTDLEETFGVYKGEKGIIKPKQKVSSMPIVRTESTKSIELINIGNPKIAETISTPTEKPIGKQKVISTNNTQWESTNAKHLLEITEIRRIISKLSDFIGMVDSLENVIKLFQKLLEFNNLNYDLFLLNTEQLIKTFKSNKDILTRITQIKKTYNMDTLNKKIQELKKELVENKDIILNESFLEENDKKYFGDLFDIPSPVLSSTPVSKKPTFDKYDEFMRKYLKY